MLKLSEQDAVMLIAALEQSATTNEKLKVLASRHQTMCCRQPGTVNLTAYSTTSTLRKN